MVVGTTTVVDMNTVLFGGQFVSHSHVGGKEGSGVAGLSEIVGFKCSSSSLQQLFSQRSKILLQFLPAQSV